VIAVFLLAAAAVLATAVLLAASLRLASPVAFVLAVWLAATGEIVLLTEILSPLSLARGWGYAAGEAVLLALAVAVWRRRGSPRPPALPRIALVPALRAHPVLAFLAAVVALAFVYQAFIAIGTPPNNWDSLAYHLSRAAGWMQAHGVEYLPAHTERQNAFQPNAEIMILWTFAFIARDTFAAVPQLLAGVVLLVSVYGIGRRLGFSRPAALLPALLGATLTEIALQTVTTQNDLFAAAFVLACAYFALGRARIDLVLAGAALGLALGTKLTSVFALPVLVGLLLAGRRRQELPALLGRATAWAAAGFIVFGLYGYAQNLAETGRVLGDPSASAHLQPEVTAGGTVSTAARIAWRLIDTSGYHLPDGAASAVGDAGEAVFDALGIAANPEASTTTPFAFPVSSIVDEDLSYFGPLGALLLPLAVCWLVAWARRRATLQLALLALSIPLFVLVLALAYRYNGWIGRFMLVPVALTLPLAAWTYERKLLGGRWPAALLAVVGALTLGLAHTYNRAKPTGIDGGPAIWSMSRAEAQSVMRPELTPSLVAFEQLVPPGKRIGTILGEDDWDYPLYGERLDRELVPITTAAAQPLSAARLARVHWVVVGSGIPGPPLEEQWLVQTPLGGWKIYLRPEELGD
jgi:hypothetical protein